MKIGKVGFAGCATPYCSGTEGRCGYCGATWGNCKCTPDYLSCYCEKKKEGFDWWNAFTIICYQLRFGTKNWFWKNAPVWFVQWYGRTIRR